MILETSRLIIRPICLDDRERLFEYRSDKEENKYQGWIPETVDDAEVFIGKLSKQIDEHGTWFQFAIIEKESQQLVGDLGTHFFDEENMQVEIGITLNKKFQNRGFATESLKRILDYLFNDLNKHRIITSIDPRNVDSIRLVERIGFRKEAHFVKSLFINREWVDDVIYALLKEEWENKTSL